MKRSMFKAAAATHFQPPMPAYAGGQVATGGTVGMLGNRNVMDTPFNQTNYTQQVIQDQQARTIADVLENDPSVRSILPPGGGNNQYFFRGFRVNQSDFGLNGLYGIVPSWSASVDYVERVEVLKGPSILLNGMLPGGAVGGMPIWLRSARVTSLSRNSRQATSHAGKSVSKSISASALAKIISSVSELTEPIETEIRPLTITKMRKAISISV